MNKTLDLLLSFKKTIETSDDTFILDFDNAEYPYNFVQAKVGSGKMIFCFRKYVCSNGADLCAIATQDGIYVSDLPRHALPCGAYEWLTEAGLELLSEKVKELNNSDSYKALLSDWYNGLPVHEVKLSEEETRREARKLVFANALGKTDGAKKLLSLGIFQLNYEEAIKVLLGTVSVEDVFTKKAQGFETSMIYQKSRDAAIAAYAETDKGAEPWEISLHEVVSNIDTKTLSASLERPETTRAPAMSSNVRLKRDALLEAIVQGELMAEAFVSRSDGAIACMHFGRFGKMPLTAISKLTYNRKIVWERS